MRVDAKKNLKKVATEVLKNPLQTQKEIAEKTGLSQSSVSSKLVEVDNTEKEEAILRIAKDDLDIVTLGQEITRLSLTGFKKKVTEGDDISPADVKHIASTAEISQKRYSIFMGANTDGKGAAKKTMIVVADSDAARALEELTE